MSSRSPTPKSERRYQIRSHSQPPSLVGAVATASQNYHHHANNNSNGIVPPSLSSSSLTIGGGQPSRTVAAAATSVPLYHQIFPTVNNGLSAAGGDTGGMASSVATITNNNNNINNNNNNVNGSTLMMMNSFCRPWTLAPAVVDGTSMTSSSQHRQTVAPENHHHAHQPAVLIYKMQLLHCVEVATKRLLFHLVKTSASMPNLFRALPFLLFALSFLCFAAFSPRSAAISFHLLPDSFHFGDASSVVTSAAAAAAVDHHGPCLFARSDNVDRNQFPEDNPTFDASDKQSPAEFIIILTIRGNQQVDTVLPPSNETALAFIDLFERIQQITVAHQKLIYKWYDMCRRCRLDPVVEHLLHDNLEWTFPEAIEHGTGKPYHDSMMSSVENGTTTFHAEKQQPRIFLGGTIGDVEMGSANGKQLRRARSLLMRIKLKPQLKLPILSAFERRLRRIVSNWTRSSAATELGTTDDDQQQQQQQQLQVHYFSAQRWTEEMEHAFRSVHFKMIASFVPITLILLFACGTKRDAYESRPLIGLSIALVLALSICSMYIVHIAGTGQLNPLLFPLPYVLVSIGTLCFSTINACMDRYSGISMHPTEKLAFIFIWDGPCLVHTLVSLAALCVLSSLSLANSLLIQSLHAFAVGFLCLMLFTLFLIVCWLNYARRVASGLKWFQFCRTGDQAYNEKQIFDYDSRTCARLHEKLVDVRPSFARRVGALACSQHFRLVVFALFTVACFWALMWGKPIAELGMAHFVPTWIGTGSISTSSRAFLDRYRVAFPKYDQYLELDFEGPLNYEERKEQIFALLRWPLDAGLANKAVSWLAEFDKYQKNVDYRIDENSILPLLTHIFLPSKQFHKFASDVYISQGQIHRSRMYLVLNDEGKKNNEFLMREILARARHAGLPLVLKAPFSFNPVHDLLLISHLNSAFLALSILSALLNIFQPATAVCLLITNLFMWTTVRAISQQLFHIPLNIVTLGTLLFGILFNSSTVLHFAYHFFNSGLRQRESSERVQYAFQCTFWPILLASTIGPVGFSVQLFFEQYPPLVLHVWQMLTLCSAVTFLQTIIVLPGLLLLFADYFHFVFTYANQLCDENANAALTVDPMGNNVYFVPNISNNNNNNGYNGCCCCYYCCCYSCTTTAERAEFNGTNSRWTSGGGGSRLIYPSDQPYHHYPHHRPYPCHSPSPLPPAYFPPPIEFHCRSVAQQAIQHHQQQQHRMLVGNNNGGGSRLNRRAAHQRQQGIGSPISRLSMSATTPTVYSPSPNHQRRRPMNEGGDGTTSATVVAAAGSGGGGGDAKRTSIAGNSPNESSMESYRQSSADHEQQQHQNHRHHRCIINHSAQQQQPSINSQKMPTTSTYSFHHLQHQQRRNMTTKQPSSIICSPRFVNADSNHCYQQHQIDDDNDDSVKKMKEEQIYEEPDSPPVAPTTSGC